MELLAHSMSQSERAALLGAERAGGPFPAYRDDHDDLRIVPLGAAERVRIGRATGNDVVLEGDREVSRSHALLEAKAGGVDARRRRYVAQRHS